MSWFAYYYAISGCLVFMWFFYDINFSKYKEESNDESEVDEYLKKLKKLANTLAIMHKLNIKSDLPCQYKTIKIDLKKPAAMKFTAALSFYIKRGICFGKA